MNLSHVLFSPNGRIGQQEYWIGVLILIAGNVVTGIVPSIGGLLWLGLVWVGIAVFGKRLHDGGKTAWLHVIPWAITSVLAISALSIVGVGVVQLVLDAAQNDRPSTASIAAMIAAGGFSLLLFSVAMLVWAGYTIWVGLLKGDASENQYGPVPLSPEAQASPDTAL
ncbi:DUF805 domain-containing protein [Hyphomonadaceae bacterium ML37]|nr:DUF805 domain-containing protein [Hyphomonadaceae bacterium ML37]